MVKESVTIIVGGAEGTVAQRVDHGLVRTGRPRAGCWLISLRTLFDTSGENLLNHSVLRLTTSFGRFARILCHGGCTMAFAAVARLKLLLNVVV